MEVLVVISIVLGAGAVVLLTVLLLRSSRGRDLSPLSAQLTYLKEGTDRLERALRQELGQNREEIGNSLKMFGDSLSSRLAEIANLQKNQLDMFSKQLAVQSQANEHRLDKMRETVEGKLSSLQEDNHQQLEQMRATVDEKLHATLEHRLGQSFKIVSERLEQVHKGLGEMQTLASGVGDLKRVLTNVKSRGTWGEIQLGNLLEQILSAEQYERNVTTKLGSNDRVEYAIRLPGGVNSNGSPMWIPIDAKFPQESYHRLLEAQEQANASLVEEAGRMLESTIRMEAKTIREKYLDPPRTTDFGIMFLPTEGLYAEVTRRIGLCEVLQREYRVIVAGPNTLGAFLNSLQMGFRTLAIEKRSSEVWALLGAVKTEFGRFGEILEKTKKKLDEASNTIDSAAAKSRTIERKLRDVQDLPSQEPLNFLDPTEEEETDALL